MIPKTWPRHYCGRAHNPKYPCPAPEWEPGGVPLSKLPVECGCEGIDHAGNCPRRKVITLLEQRRRGHNQK